MSSRRASLSCRTSGTADKDSGSVHADTDTPRTQRTCVFLGAAEGAGARALTTRPPKGGHGLRPAPGPCSEAGAVRRRPRTGPGDSEQGQVRAAPGRVGSWSRETRFPCTEKHLVPTGKASGSAEPPQPGPVFHTPGSRDPRPRLLGGPPAPPAKAPCSLHAAPGAPGPGSSPAATSLSGARPGAAGSPGSQGEPCSRPHAPPVLRTSSGLSRQAQDLQASQHQPAGARNGSGDWGEPRAAGVSR